MCLMWRERARETLARTDRDTARLYSRLGAWEGPGGLGERAQAALALLQRAYRGWPTTTGPTTQIWPAGVRCDTHHAKPAHAL